MKYEFVCKADGARAYVELPPDQAPEIGAELVHTDGRVFTRVFSVPAPPKIQQQFTARSAGFTSHQLPRNWRHHVGDFDSSGRPRFRSRREVDEACARHNQHDDSCELRYGEL